MTTRQIVATPEGAARVMFPDTPKEDMQNLLFLNDPGFIPALRRHLGAWDTTAVLSEFPIGWRNARERLGLQVPDLMIAFDVDPTVIVMDNGYSIEYHGKAPDFVLEIASPRTRRRDENEKRVGYEAFGVLEYWRFDNTGGRYYRAPLAGDRLVNGKYEPIPVWEESWARQWGYSEALGLYLCWEYGYLRWYDPNSGYLRDHYELAEAQATAEAGRLAAEARVRELEAEVRRLENR